LISERHVFNPEIVQSSTRGKNPFNKQIPSQAAFIFDCPVTLNAPDGMFCPDPERGNHSPA
jgi:hypothetical protein